MIDELFHERGEGTISSYETSVDRDFKLPIFQTRWHS